MSDEGMSNIEEPVDSEATAPAGEPETGQQDRRPLWIVGGIVVVLVALFACCVLAAGAFYAGREVGGGDQPAPAPTEERTDLVGQWQWVETAFSDDSTLTVNAPKRYTIEFRADGAVNVRADCNNASGSYTVQGASVSIVLGLMTMAECGPDSLSNEFVRQLIINLMADSGNMKFAPG